MFGVLLEALFGLYGSWRACRNGRRDGRAGVPAPGEEALFEHELRAVFEGEVGRVAEAWHRRDARLRHEWQVALHEYEQAGQEAAREERELAALRDEHAAMRRQLGEAAGWQVLSSRWYYPESVTTLVATPSGRPRTA